MKYYLSKNYSNYVNAGNKAKTDIEEILSKNGFENAGLKQSAHSNKIIGFLITLFGVIKSAFCLKKGDWLLLQYPFKKYYVFECNLAHWKGAKVITVIHDLGSFRRKKLTVPQEITKLNHSDIIIAHNSFMNHWLIKQHCKAQIEDLQIFDYLSDKRPDTKETDYKHYQILYAGGLSKRKNSYLYQFGNHIHSFEFNIYGSGLDKNELKDQDHVHYKGFLPSDELIEHAEGDFGLAWEGHSLTCYSGDFGTYIQYNNPHKISLYLRCHIPVIIWSKAALAPFIEQNKIGFCLDSLETLDEKLRTITPEQYAQMKQNTIAISQKLAQGYYIQQALKKAFER